MAEGLEEESKKSLQMEAELEKQGHVFEADKKSLKSQLASKEARYGLPIFARYIFFKLHR